MSAFRVDPKTYASISSTADAAIKEIDIDLAGKTAMALPASIFARARGDFQLNCINATQDVVITLDSCTAIAKYVTKPPPYIRLVSFFFTNLGTHTVKIMPGDGMTLDPAGLLSSPIPAEAMVKINIGMRAKPGVDVTSTLVHGAY